jgi:hypothetical protein
MNMGQRHQIYIRMNTKEGPKVLGYHHQWLFGKTAVETLIRALTFAKADAQCNYGVLNRGYDGGRDASRAFEAVLSVDVSSGYYHNVYPFQFNPQDESDYEEAALTDPRQGDNNNGITIIDLTGKKPKYCFMSVHHLECLADGEAEKRAETDLVLEPLSASTWLDLHYPTNSKHDMYKSWKGAEVGKNIAYCSSLKRKLSKVKVLTRDEVAAIFPKMYGKNVKRKAA